MIKVTNHPVHIVDDEDEDGRALSPSALIPFCEFGGNLSAMGVKIDQVEVPVCNSFRPKIYKDQLCYTVDPNVHKYKIDMKGEISLTLAIDYNEDRDFYYKANEETLNKSGDGGFGKIRSKLSKFITVETIGRLLAKLSIPIFSWILI